MPERNPQRSESETRVIQPETHTAPSPDKALFIAQFIEKKILGQNQSPELAAELSSQKLEALGKQFAEYFTVRERAELLYEKLIAYIKTKQSSGKAGQGQTPETLQIDPYLVAEITALWKDQNVQEKFGQKYAESRKGIKDAKTNPFGRELASLDTTIAKLEQDHEQVVQKLFLKTAGQRMDVESALKSKSAFLARQLNAKRQRKEQLLNLDPAADLQTETGRLKELLPTPEVTDTLALEQYGQLKEYRDQAQPPQGFVWLPHFETLKKKIVHQLENGKWPVLKGEAGTGKSDLADAAALHLTGELPTHVACNAKTSVRDIWIDRDVEKGSSYRTYGKALQAATGYENSSQEKPVARHGRVVRFDEWGRLGDEVYAQIKEMRQLKPGDVVEGKKVLPGFAAIMTTNPPGARYPNRREPDAAMRREIADITIDYPPQSNQDPETYEFMLQALMDQNYHINASQKELAPFFEHRTFDPDKQINIDEHKKAIGQDQLLADPTDSRHGALWRLSFAIRELQNAFDYGNMVDIPSSALRFKETTDSTGRPTGRLEIAQTGGEQLTLSNTTITLGELAKMMSGFNERYSKDDPEFHTKTLTAWVQYKLKLFLEQTDGDDREKARAIFAHYHLFDAPPKLDEKTDQPLTPKDIGYLSPRVKRPLTIETLKNEAAAKTTEVPKIERPKTFETLRTWTAVLTDGSEVKYSPAESWTFSKHGQQVDVRSGVSFEFNGQQYIFAGRIEDKASDANGQLIVRLASEDLHEILSKEQIEQGENFSLSVNLAKELLDSPEDREQGKTNVLGPEEVSRALGFDIPSEKVPALIKRDGSPISLEDIEKAKALGEMLMLRIAEDSSGQPLAIKRLMEIAQARFNGPDDGKVLYASEIDPTTRKVEFKSDAWYKAERFALSEAPKLEWKFVGKELVPDSTSKNYIDQTKTLRDYLAANGLATQAELAECTDQRLEAIRTLMATDWKKAAQELAALAVNQNHRRRPVEALYDFVVSYKNNLGRLQESNYDWTNAISSDGNLVDFGSAVDGGAFVNGSKPGISRDHLGVVSVR